MSCTTPPVWERPRVQTALRTRVQHEGQNPTRDRDVARGKPSGPRGHERSWVRAQPPPPPIPSSIRVVTALGAKCRAGPPAHGVGAGPCRTAPNRAASPPRTPPTRALPVPKDAPPPPPRGHRTHSAAAAPRVPARCRWRGAGSGTARRRGSAPGQRGGSGRPWRGATGRRWRQRGDAVRSAPGRRVKVCARHPRVGPRTGRGEVGV